MMNVGSMSGSWWCMKETASLRPNEEIAQLRAENRLLRRQLRQLGEHPVSLSALGPILAENDRLVDEVRRLTRELARHRAAGEPSSPERLEQVPAHDCAVRDDVLP
ncbi:MAG: hypothetical protein JWO42_2352 [Chloroflexi bacterium]|nr:hypothetical protein [Chloroflexota bacterium]